jgi:tetratricopeptide (TPR) repeat protein
MIVFNEEVEMPVNPCRAGVKMTALLFLALTAAFSCGPGQGESASPGGSGAPAVADAVPPGTGRPGPVRSLPRDGSPPPPGAEQPTVEGLEQGSDLAAMFQQGAELARTGLYDRALELFEQVLAERPDHVPTLINAARVHFLRGRTEKAIELLERADRLMPDNPRILAYLGMAESKAGRFEDALVHLEGASLLDPTRIDVGNELAGVYFELERYEEAAEAWGRVLKLDPDNLLARAGLEQIDRQSPPADAGAPPS